MNWKRTNFSTRPYNPNDNSSTNKEEMTSYTQNNFQNVHNATAITTGSVNQQPNTPCIKLWIDVIFRGLENSYTQGSKLKLVRWLMASEFSIGPVECVLHLPGWPVKF